jgi:hypothetical protein
MTGLTLTLGGRQLMFATTGDVADVTAAGTTTVGSWRSDAPEADNQIRYVLAGADQPPLKAAYTFNDQNQLVLTAAGDGNVAAAFTFQGRIEVLRDHNFGYFLVNDDGSDAGPKITVYVTSVQFAESTNNLQLVLAGGGQAEITGASGTQSLEAERNVLPTFKAQDLLTFEAVTSNPLADGSSQDIPADLKFAGSFDLAGDRLVFLSEVQTGPRNTVNIGFAGRVGAVTGGFVYFADGVTTEVALNIRGQHVFKSSTGQTDLTWETSLGYTGKTFTAAVDVDLTKTTAKGGILDLNGKLRLEKPAGGAAPTFDLNLKATYAFDSSKSKVLVFTAHVVGGAQPAYDLMLEGTFVYSNLKLTFLIQYTNAAGAQAIHAEVGIQGDKSDMTTQLKFVLDLQSDKQASLQLKASFEVRMRFANGIRVKDPATPIAGK